MSGAETGTAGTGSLDHGTEKGTNLEAHWAAVYERSALDAVSWYQDVPEKSLEMISRCRLAADAAIIDVGGGASLLVDHLLDGGFSNLSVLDIAGAALASARDRLMQRAAQVQWIQSDVTCFRPPQRYALWHDRAVLHFLLEEEDRLRYRAVMEDALLPGAHCVFAAFAPDGPERCSGLNVWQYDGTRLLDLLGPRFHLVEEEREDHVTPSGSVQRFSWCRVAFDAAASVTTATGGDR